MSHPTSMLTADQLLSLPVPDGLLGYELVSGEPVEVTPASFMHGRLIIRIGRIIDAHVEGYGLPGAVVSDTGFVLGLPHDPERTRAPDVAYVRSATLEANPDRGRFIRGVPALAVEIDLTSGKKPGGQQRIVDYLEAGVPLVWAIDPHSKTATVYRPDGAARLVRSGESLEGGDVLPDLRIDLAELFG